jgi:hypothetical protein
MPIADVLAAATVRPVYIGYLDIKNDPLRGWTGPGTLLPSGTGDPDLDGQTFLSADGAVEITAFQQDMGIGGPVTITFAAAELDGGVIPGEGDSGGYLPPGYLPPGYLPPGYLPPGASGPATSPGDIFQRIIIDRRAFVNRKARFWLAFLNATESAILPEIEPMFTGVMINAQVFHKAGQPATLTLTCDLDLQKANAPPVRWIDHQQYNPDDTWSAHINALARGPSAGVNRSTGPGTRPGDPDHTPRWTTPGRAPRST